MLTTVSKAGDVLGLFTLDRPEWGVSDVAAKLGIAKSSAHDLLDTLTDSGLVRRTSHSRYRLGWRILELNRALVLTTDFLNGSREPMSLLAENLGVTIHVAGLRGREVVCLDEVTGSRSVGQSESGVGLPMPAHATAAGKVLLAFADVERRAAVIDHHGLQRRTRCTQTCRRRLDEELVVIRTCGYGCNLQEARMDICCIAAPIRDASGSTQAAVSFSMPATEFGREHARVRRAVMRLAALLSGAAPEGVGRG